MSAESKRVAKLLLKAAGKLPAKEQQDVLEYLVDRGIADEERGRPRLRGFAGPPYEQAGAGVHRPGLEAAVRSVAGAQQMVPVRLSEEQHARLKQWCKQNGFSMAVVLRGLIEQFLGSQPPKAGKGPA